MYILKHECVILIIICEFSHLLIRGLIKEQHINYTIIPGVHSILVLFSKKCRGGPWDEPKNCQISIFWNIDLTQGTPKGTVGSVVVIIRYDIARR